MIYESLRTLLFAGDPERVHDRVLACLESAGKSSAGRALVSAIAGNVPTEPVRTMGLSFEHPIGLAAGFDKDARALRGLFALKFSFVEIGTVTPQPQPGNPKPRMWRFPEAAALVNALGFPGEGMLAVKLRLAKLREQDALTRPIGINLGKNAFTPLAEAAGDYKLVLRELLELGDYFVVNVSSPNTPGLRTLQQLDSLRALLDPLQQIAVNNKPLLLKIAPDLADEDVTDAARVVSELGLAGIVCANTSIRRDIVPGADNLDRGGLSGAPIYPRMLTCLKLLRSELPPEHTLIAVGGIDSAARVRECLYSGAQLVQIYTAFIYRGPQVVRKLLGATS
ncbi:quinone-dependent dihydroorotate dehydrogenase [bacterium]|nr:quinone-dependent dihydroorotate dehydrogenase [bacterium]